MLVCNLFELTYLNKDLGIYVGAPRITLRVALCQETGPDQAPEYALEPYDPEGLDAIKRNGSQANYMRDDHTLKNTGKAFVC